FHGILNGIDDELYNPKHDAFIPFPYSIEDANRAKSGNKEQLQSELGLEINSSVPMYGFVSRLTDQKGLSLIEKVLQSSPLLQHAQVIILGIGEKYWERRLKILADQRS